MDENVIYNPQSNQNTPSEGTPPPENPPTEVSPMEVPEQDSTLEPETTPDPNAEVPSQETPADGSGDATSGDDTASAEDVPPPPSGIAGLLSGGKLKFIIGGVVLVLIIIVILLLIPKKSSSQHVELTWYGLWEDEQTVKPIIDGFTRENPNITIKYEKQDPQQYRDRLLARIEKGTGPDIFRYHNTWYPMLSDILLPLSEDVIPPDEFKKVYYPVIQNDLVHNGAIYGIPLEADSLSLFVNTDLLKKAGVSPPRTWEDFVKAAKQLTVYDQDTQRMKIAGAALGKYSNVTHAPDIISMMFVQQGVSIPDITNGVSDEKDALDFYTSFVKGNQEDIVWDKTLDPSMVTFARGNLALYFGYSWDVLQMQAINPDLKFAVYPVPDLYGKNTTIASYWVEGVSAKSPHSKEALLFMKYLAKKETAQKFYSETAKGRPFGEPYARMDLADSLKNNKLVYPFVNQLNNATSSYFVSDTHDGESGLNSILNGYLESAVTSITESNSSIDSAVGGFNQGVSQTYEKYGIQPTQTTK